MDISLLSLNKSQPRMLDTSLQLWKSYLGIRTGVKKNYSISANEILHQQICYFMVFSKMKKLQPSFWPYDCFLSLF